MGCRAALAAAAEAACISPAVEVSLTRGESRAAAVAADQTSMATSYPCWRHQAVRIRFCGTQILVF